MPKSPQTPSALPADPDVLRRIAEALERLAPVAPGKMDFGAADAFIWHPGGRRLAPVPRVNRVDMSLLKGIDRMRDILVENTERFARGLPANNALLWGARGMGKSSLVKATHAAVNASLGAKAGTLKLIEIHREDIESLPDLMSGLRGVPYRFIVFCDDLSFDASEPGYKALKVMLDGTIAAAAANMLIYATSNRRHLMPEYFSENLETKHLGGEVHPGESVEEKISLSERFGLWVSFYPFSQDDYLAAVGSWLTAFGVAAPKTSRDAEARHHEAVQFALQRGSRSGRVAWQFARGYAGAAALRGKKRNT
jgi:uncharacterized protein